ncbi:MAG: class I SAM-dependent methyltransferase [Oscillospiraceae bacterium]|nr:class I SAM-dependent methyltransferase [Oscillospiraceae bacterium]
MLNDYQKQAEVWDWDGYDDTPEYEYWCEYAKRFGNRVLIPMCAYGQTGAYMAQKGFHVTAFDITPEMIAEGKRRYGEVKNLELVVADLTDLDLNEKEFDFAFIAGNGDLHLLQSAQMVGRAFLSIQKHLRTGGCLTMELTLPERESWSYPKKMFHPRVPNYADKKIWKENEGRYDAGEKRHYINQTVYIENNDGIKSFMQSVCLQYYEREEILGLLRKCGFTVKSEYRNREKETWKSGDSSWFVEAVLEAANNG